MSVHVHRCNWDGKSDPTDSHVDAVAIALKQNYKYLKPKWTPAGFAILCAADGVMHDAARILDFCGGEPTPAELTAALDRLIKPRKDGRHVARRNFLERIFKRVEELLDNEEADELDALERLFKRARELPDNKEADKKPLVAH